jgi:hypothetical protein
MKIFISWSGDRSKHIATAIKPWLTDVLPDVETWMSDHNIEAGSRWGTDLNRELQSTNFGILCLTPENLKSSWLLFEAGSLAKALQEARVVPYLYNLTPADVGFPLAQFQGVSADEQGTWKLLQSLNSAREVGFSTEKLERSFKKWWPDLQSQLEIIPQVKNASEPQRSDRTLLEEILQLVRTRGDGSEGRSLDFTYLIKRYDEAESQQRDSWKRFGKELEGVPDLLNRAISTIREELRSAFTLYNQALMWTKSETVYQVQEDDLSAMDTATITRYLDQVQELYMRTKDPKLLDKIKLAKAGLTTRPVGDA